MSTGCGRPERAILQDFFNESRLRDLTALRRFSTVTFEPLQQGIVTDFTIDKAVADGDTKTVTVTADVKRPDGRLVPETLLVMMERRVVRDGASERREWMITGVLEKPR